MHVLQAVSIVVAGIGLLILHRATVWHIRQACGVPRAETLAICTNGAALSAFIASTLLLSLPAFVVGCVLMSLNFAPSLLVRATGGPDEICFLRRSIRDLHSSIGRDPLPPERIVELRAKLAELDAFRSPLARPVVEAIQEAIGLLLSGTSDRSSIHRAYDVVDARMAELRAVHPW